MKAETVAEVFDMTRCELEQYATRLRAELSAARDHSGDAATGVGETDMATWSAVIEDVAIEHMTAWKAAEFEHAWVHAKRMAAKVIEVMSEGLPTPEPAEPDYGTKDGQPPTHVITPEPGAEFEAPEPADAMPVAIVPLTDEEATAPDLTIMVEYGGFVPNTAEMSNSRRGEHRVAAAPSGVRLREALEALAEAARNACHAQQHPPLTAALFEADRILSTEGGER